MILGEKNIVKKYNISVICQIQRFLVAILKICKLGH